MAARRETSKRVLDAQLAALSALRAAGDTGETRARLRAALDDRNNLVVARAANLTAELGLEALIPELLAAFERFFQDAAKTDPGCLAKAALAEGLRSLEHHDAAPFVRGITHVQLEPGWGGSTDTAAALRGACALGLAECHLDYLETLTYLADGLGDADPSVRSNSAIAISRLGRPEGALLLRLKLRLGDAVANVLGNGFAALLSLEPPGAVAFVSQYLHTSDADVQAEAASALAQCRDPEAVAVLRQFWAEPLLSSELRHLLVINLGASPVPEAAELLLQVVAEEDVALAAGAVAALASSRFRTPLRERLAAAVHARNSPELQRAFEREFGA